jgi:hypothetical protein
MNNRQKFILVVAVVVMACSGIYPPYTSQVTGKNPPQRSFLFDPPANTYGIFVYKIDLRQLFVEWFLTALLAGGLICILAKPKRKAKSDEDTASNRSIQPNTEGDGLKPAP